MLRLTRLPTSAAWAFFGLVLLTTCLSSQAAQPVATVLPDNVLKTLLKPHQQAANPLPRQLNQHLQEAADLIEEAIGEDKLQQAGHANLLASKQQLLESKRADIADLRQDVQAELELTRARLAQLKQIEPLDTFDRYAKQVNQRFDRLNRSLADFGSAQQDVPRRQALHKVKAELDALYRPEDKTEANLGNYPAPTSSLGAEVKPTPAQPSKNLPQYLSAVIPSQPNTPRYAFLLDFLAKPVQAAAPAIPSQAASCGYAAADLAAGEDVVITADIQNLAAQLNYSPVKIYQYVYNTIKYEPYFGSLKGSAGTFYSNAGGSTDQASLLIALLRASNIPARYVLGDIQVVDGSNLGANGRAPQWIGAKNYGATASILTSNLNPNAGILKDPTGSFQVGVQLRHVWVEACLPYGNYRGAVTDNSGYRWTPASRPTPISQASPESSKRFPSITVVPLPDIWRHAPNPCRMKAMPLWSKVTLKPRIPATACWMCLISARKPPDRWTSCR